MGAASFIMASFLGIPYLKIMYAGIIPALFYYFAIFVVVDFRAQKIGLKGLDPSEIPVLKDVMKEQGHLALPIVVILYFLVKGVTPLYAAFFGLISTVVFSGLKKSTRMSLKDILNALDEGARTAVAIAIACGVVGFIVGVVAMTGLGQVIALNIMKLSFGYLWLALILVMIASIFLGMGLPATACYIITASVAAPALIRMGVLPIAAHFFAFYYGTLSAVVPPVALTSYTAAGISGANPTEVAFSGFKLAIAGLIIPFMFVYSPILLMQNVVPGYLIMTVITGLLGIYSLGVANENYFRSPLKIHERLMALGAALLMIKPGYLTDSMGIALMALFILSNLYRNKKAKEKLLSA
jgi:TRAP transporter 4TM/12TM fusion protein